MRTKTMRLMVMLTAGLALLGTMVAEAATNVSTQVSVNHGGYARQRATGLWSTTLVVTNTGSGTINGPVNVVLTNLSANATMANSNGTYQGSPYITVSPDPIAPKASVKVTIQFQNPSNDFITFTPVTQSGDLQ